MLTTCISKMPRAAPCVSDTLELRWLAVFSALAACVGTMHRAFSSYSLPLVV